MATKQARAKAVTKKPAKKAAVRKAVPAKRDVRPEAPNAFVPRARKTPETLRLKSFTPGLTVSDLHQSIAFYTEGLGFIIGDRWTNGDALIGVMLKAGSSQLGLSQDDWKMGKGRQKGAGIRVWCDTTQDIDAIAARVKAAGFKLTEEPADNPQWGLRSFSVDDPDGFHITISRDL